MSASDHSKDFLRHLVGSYAPIGPELVRGKGARVYDRAGKDYIDMAGGIAVSALGHAHPGLLSELTKQASRLIHVSNLFYNARSVEVARQLTKLTHMEQAFFCNSGAEANEAALKIARKRGVAIDPGKHEVVSLNGGFHGRVGLALAATAKASIREPFGPQPPGFVHVDPDEAALRGAVGDRTCAVIAEPIQGESGLRTIPEAILALMRKLCDEHDALLIIDEIQTGMGRTGRPLASGRSLRPDIVTLAKGLGAGVPIGATLVANKAVGVIGPGDHGTTFGGNALSLAAASVVLREISSIRLQEKVASSAEALRGWAEGMIRRGAPIAEIRGRGLMTGLRISGPKKAAELAAEAVGAGVLLAPAGDNVLRMLPPLNISPAEIRDACERLERVLL